jgi:hypothetical protein
LHSATSVRGQPSARQKATVKIVVPRRAIGANSGEAHAAYRSDSLMWMQVAELSFDSFMMRMRT